MSLRRAHPSVPWSCPRGITGPVLWISARGDQLVTPEDADAFRRRMSELGKPFESHIYDDESAGHAFFDEDISPISTTPQQLSGGGR